MIITAAICCSSITPNATTTVERKTKCSQSRKKKKSEKRPRGASRKSCRVGRGKAKAVLPVSAISCLHAYARMRCNERSARRRKTVRRKTAERSMVKRNHRQKRKGRASCMQAEMQYEEVRVCRVASPCDGGSDAKGEKAKGKVSKKGRDRE